MVGLSVLLHTGVGTVLPAHTAQAGDATEQLLMFISCRSGRERQSERSHCDRSIARAEGLSQIAAATAFSPQGSSVSDRPCRDATPGTFFSCKVSTHAVNSQAASSARRVRREDYQRQGLISCAARLGRSGPTATGAGSRFR